MDKEKRAPHRTQWAAQFAVASELCKRGYEVSFTMGNTTPLADLMVVSPKLKQMFLVDVKGLYRKNAWNIKSKPPRDNLYYVLALVPDDAANQFFIMTQKEMNASINENLKRLGQPDDYTMPGIVWGQASKHGNRWGILPE